MHHIYASGHGNEPPPKESDTPEPTSEPAKAPAPAPVEEPKE